MFADSAHVGKPSQVQVESCCEGGDRLDDLTCYIIIDSLGARGQGVFDMLVLTMRSQHLRFT